MELSKKKLDIAKSLPSLGSNVKDKAVKEAKKDKAAEEAFKRQRKDKEKAPLERKKKKEFFCFREVLSQARHPAKSQAARDRASNPTWA
ncbi:hypothetical protein R1flu_027747 [Riccia fluitans]|uniref:Uncharacterized protein n=1 Tax=Riccia fluitans TaxID=41844 RepID=A0ABD1XJP3_9MARC